MSTTQIRRKLKIAIDAVPEVHLATLSEFVAFLGRPTLKQRIELAERQFKAGKGTNWRAVRDDV